MAKFNLLLATPFSVWDSQRKEIKIPAHGSIETEDVLLLANLRSDKSRFKEVEPESKTLTTKGTEVKADVPKPTKAAPKVEKDDEDSDKKGADKKPSLKGKDSDAN